MTDYIITYQSSDGYTSAVCVSARSMPEAAAKAMAIQEAEPKKAAKIMEIKVRKGGANE